jgi:hypothetical protein
MHHVGTCANLDLVNVVPTRSRLRDLVRRVIFALRVVQVDCGGTGLKTLQLPRAPTAHRDRTHLVGDVLQDVTRQAKRAVIEFTLNRVVKGEEIANTASG